MTSAVILGSAFERPTLVGRDLEPLQVATRFGPTLLHFDAHTGGHVLFRHGAPHRFLPNQIPYRAQAAALNEVGCDRLLVTSSVGVLDHDLPLDAPIPIGDILMLGNSLPDGTACTVFPDPVAGQWHLVLDAGLISDPLTAQFERLCRDAELTPGPRAVFAYTPGPRNKTAAENVAWVRLGAQIDSMTVGPEIVLANEFGISCAAVGVGHKYSGPGQHGHLERQAMADSLVRGQRIVEVAADAFLRGSTPVEFGNRFFRYP